ncbi:MAG: sigma-70 family RNA polymerase sigma factor [Clostridia bacterium]|nr:sigma-70 family RNA polymerase sigma factor [Clostridia bacterium]
MTPDEKERFYAEYKGKVLSYIRSRVFNASDAEDLCGDVFVKAFSAADSFDPSKASAGTWLYSITRNTVIDYFRRFHPTEEISEDISDECRTEDGILESETLEELAAALEQLPAELTDIVVLHYFDRIPLTEIAASLNISYGMVKIRHHKALALLRAAMK